MTIIYLSILSYIAVMFALAKIPENFWAKLLKFGPYFKDLHKQAMKKIPMFGDINRGKDLLLAFSDCEAKLSLGLKILAPDLPRYKFYTDLLEQLFETHRKLGIGIKKFIPDIRLGLIKDLQFEKKIFDEIISGFLQFVVIAGTTWGFVFLSSSLVFVPLSKFIVLIMIFLQVSGAILFLILIKKMKKRIFFKFSHSIEELYLFNCLLEIGLPLNEILMRSKILQGHFVSFKIFNNLSERIRKLIIRLKETGISPRDEAQEIIQEVWQLQEENFLQFSKMVQILKFIILAMFYLPAYFVYLYSIFKFFMEQ